jgi:hypothetical protein
MNRLILIFFTLLSITSCYHVNKQEVVPPDPLIPKEEMVSILADIYLAEGALAYNRLDIKDKKIAEKYSTAYYVQIFDKYHINHRILKENLNYYNSDPKNMEKILEEVLAHLSRLQSEVETTGGLISDTITQSAVDTTANMPSDSLVKTNSITISTSLQDSVSEEK